MGQGQACRCAPPDRVVVMYRANASAFGGYRRTPSAYSAVGCRICGALWRSRAAWVEAAWRRQGRVELWPYWEQNRWVFRPRGRVPEGPPA